MFTKGFFVVSQLYPRHVEFDKRWWRMTQHEDFWLLLHGADQMGDIFVFEQEAAARRLYAFKLTTGESYGSQTALRFIRSMTRKGAASTAAQGRGEVLEYFSPSFQEALEFDRIADERQRQAEADDVARYRAIIELAHSRFPKMDRSAIPTTMEGKASTEAIYLERYAVSLHRCGALSSDELLAVQKQNSKGYSHHRFADDWYELVMVPN